MARDRSREIFNEKLIELNNASSDRSLFLNNERYERIIQEVKEAQLLRKTNQPLKSKHYRRLRRYDILQIDDDEKLIENIGAAGTMKDASKVRGFCKLEELFDVLRTTHLDTGHKKTRKMEAELKKRYCNVTRQVIDLYLSHCEECEKKKPPKRKLVTPPNETPSSTTTTPTTKRRKDDFLIQTPILSEYMDVRGQIDLIDMQSKSDGDYKFVLNYQDQLTKFTILRPLKTKTPKEVAEQLVDIFCLFGAPFILQCSSNGREFACLVAQQLSKLWPKLKLVHGKKPNGRNCDEIKCDVRELLLSWLSTKKTMRWSEALRFVQCEMNRKVHEGIEMSPHMAMFGMTSHHGLTDAEWLSDEMLADIETEEELEKLCVSEMNKLKETEKIENEIQLDAAALTAAERENEANLSVCTEDTEDCDQAFSITEGLTPNPSNNSSNSITTSSSTLEIGSNVLVKLSKDTVSNDSEPCVALAVVTSVNADGLYELATRNGVLDRLYERSEIITNDNEFIELTQCELSSTLSLLLADKLWH